MNFSKKALAAALLSAFSVSAMAANVDIYGKANVSFQLSDDGDGSFTEIQSNASRLGFKGDHKLNDDLKVIYKAEFQVDLDGDSDDNITERTQYVGLQGNFGTVLVGKNDTMLKQSQGKIDLFNDLEGDVKVLWAGENRSSDTLVYVTPSFNGFKFGATYIAEEDEDGEAGVSLAAFYGDKALKKSKVYASIAHDTDVASKTRAFGTSGLYDITRASIQTKLAGVKLGAIYHTQENADSGAELDGFLVSAAYGINNWTLKGQYQTAEMDGGEDKSGFSVGADYKLAKPTKLYAFFTSFDMDQAEDTDYLAVGIEHKF